MQRNLRAKFSVLICTLAAGGFGLAYNADAQTPARGSAPMAAMPAAHRQGDITYVSGGIGETQSSAMKSAAAQYPLELEFLQKSTPSDEYLADIKVQIKDAQDRTVLSVNADGPFLLAQLPAGRYSISADNGGQVQHRQVNVATDQHRRVVFEWAS